MLRRCMRPHVQHPTYTALFDLGKARRTLLLCRSRRLRELRRAMHEGLNVVEQWNSAQAGILCGQGGDSAPKRREAQACAMLALHLLQNALGSLHTLRLPRVRSEAAGATRLTVEALRALTPLIDAHVRPYGPCLLALQTRLAIELPFDAGHGSDTAPIAPERRPPRTQLRPCALAS